MKLFVNVSFLSLRFKRDLNRKLIVSKIKLRYSLSRKVVGDLAAFTFCNGAITVQAFPAVLLLRGHLIEKNEIFSAFQIFID